MTERPIQAVILAGGRGERLKPLTDSIPKPMIRFHGKPFLEYLIDQLKEQGFKKVLLLLGYLPDSIIGYFGNGESFGIEIEYIVSDITDETGRRLILAEDKLDPNFLLMYCDNYWPMQIDQMWRQFCLRNSLAQITVYSNDDNNTKSNVIVEKDYTVSKYDKERTTPNLHGVDIGYVILKKEVISLISDQNINFERVIYPQLVNKGQLSAYISNHRYYSVGSHDRLKETEKFLLREPTIFLDRDGVLNRKAPKSEYITSRHNFLWLPGAIEALQLLNRANYRIIIPTNQAGVARGKMTQSDLDDIHCYMTDFLSARGVSIDAIYCCTHNWDDECSCRKPKPGMLFQAQKDFCLDLTKTYFIGDDERDKEAGEVAGCKTLILNPEFNLLKAVQEVILQ